MIHHGKALKRQIERAGLTQKEAAAKMGYATHQAFAALYQKEQFNEKQIEKLTSTFGFNRDIFLTPSTSTAQSQVPDGSCWQLLAEARQEIINLQKQIIEMSKPNVNAPKRTQQPA